jgi:hypothetical protein
VRNPQTAAQMVPGTIVQVAGITVRRRPYATGGSPWKGIRGSRYDHWEVDHMLAGPGAVVSLCPLCAEGQLCLDHDLAHVGTRPKSIGYCANCVERCEGQHGACFSEELGCTEDFRPDKVDDEGPCVGMCAGCSPGCHLLTGTAPQLSGGAP